MSNKINPNLPRGVEVVVGVIIENNKNQILLVKSPKWGNKWTIPGGHIDPGETILEAAVREAREESGLNCRPVGIFNHGKIINPPDFHRQAHFIFFGAYCRSITDDELQLDQDELIHHEWVNIEEACQYDMRSGFGNTVDEFINYKKTLK